MTSALQSINNVVIGIGVLFWFWATVPLLSQRSIFFRLHALTVGDTIGSALIVVGLLLRLNREWPLLLISLFCLLLWNTTFSVVLGHAAASDPHSTDAESST